MILTTVSGIINGNRMRNTLVITLLLGSVMSSFGTHRLRDRGFLNHMARTRAFPCSTPQLRAIVATDLIEFPNAEERFWPPTTVLARCDKHTGCCPEPQTCTAEVIEDVELVFIVNHLIDKSRLKHHEVVLAKNHTKCHCV